MGQSRRGSSKRKDPTRPQPAKQGQTLWPTILRSVPGNENQWTMRSSALHPLMLALLVQTAFAGDIAPTPSPELEQIQLLRLQIEAQSKQINHLSQQVAKLSQFLETAKRPQSAAQPAPAEPNPASETTGAPASAPAAGQAQETPREPQKEAPKIESTDPATPRHVVEKGETLTAIAKRYNISVAELQKLNKIENDRKLQIGQSLQLPTPAAAPTQEQPKNP